MAKRYTLEEWNQLPAMKQLTRTDLAPKESGELRRLDEALSDLPEVQAFKYAQDKADLLIDFVDKYGNSVCLETVAGVIELLDFSPPEIALLLMSSQAKYTGEKRKAAQSKGTEIWKLAMLERYCEQGSDFPTKEEFCEDIEGQNVTTLDGRSAKAPKAETIRKFLTDDAVADYLDELDVARRRSGIC